ncbi:hypothetical protein [Magnetospirillum sulfuroxidans]|uniref:Squalene cyclase C-terminal domain-containing protein n=1 Tax=Magnetospirillum sulfuroxidans TaxID=611300 RepID=A0ABS5ICG3_9PROT|nr:hypothetical protein [Magnetospirillum sulfuroxidans]MBR9972114.1 hypothetical protein [Magnetospirillum sulfuroxidans]
MDQSRIFGIKSLIESSLGSARSILSTSQQEFHFPGGDKGVLWPLFLTPASIGPNEAYEIDTCATSLGFIGLRQSLPIAESGDPRLAQSPLSTLIGLRKADGSWPSIQLAPRLGRADEMEGIVNDTIYALTALLDGGFLEKEISPRWPVVSTSFENLNTYRARIDWLSQTVSWIKSNRLDRGWYFTSSDYMADKAQYIPATGPTAAMVLAIDRFLKAIAGDEECPYRAILEKLKLDGIAWLKEIQHESGGFGRDGQDVPRIGHTAWALRVLLLSNDQDTEFAAIRSVDWLLKNVKSKQLGRASEQDAFDRYAQAIFTRNEIFRKRIIAHEHPLEATVLIALCEVYQHRGRLSLSTGRRKVVSKAIFSLTKQLVGRQQKDGPLRGAFRSRRNSLGEEYPLYWIAHSVLALSQVRDLVLGGQISASQNFFNSFILRTLFVAFAIGVFIAIKGFDYRELAILLILGVAVNVISIFLTRE